MLGRDVDCAVRSTFEAKQKKVALVGRLWGKHKLSHVGRLHVAKQSMASVIGYAAGFVRPPESVLRNLEGLIQTFVDCRGCFGDGPDPVSTRPARSVATLPPKEGGCGMVDLRMHVEGMQAKVMAALLHPAKRPWKVLMWRGLQKARTGANLALVQPAIGVTTTGLSKRHLGYVTAMRRTEPRRIGDPMKLPFHAVMREPLLFNAQIAAAGSGPLRVQDVAAGADRWRLSDLRRAILATPGCPRLQGLLQVLPAPWRSMVTAVVEPAAEWFCSVSGEWVREGAAVAAPRFFHVVQSGKMMLSAGGPGVSVLGGQWLPCCVVTLPVRGPARAPAVDPVMLCMGPWESLSVDPSAWGHGIRDLLHFQVQHVVSRMLHVRQGKEDASFSPVGGVRPRLWVDPQGRMAADGSPLSGLLGLQRRWQGQFDSRSVVQPVSRGGPVFDVSSLYVASWMLPSPARPSRAQRQQLRMPHTRPQGPVALRRRGVSDTLAPWPVGAVAPPWSSAWRRLCDAALPRRLRDFGWRMLHGSLCCNAARLSRPDAVVSEACCSAAGCSATLESLSHLFLECPCVAPAVGWFLDLWQAIEGRRPPLDPLVLLADDHRVWCPAPELTFLWSVLRLTLLSVVWGARCRRQAAQRPFSSVGVAAAVIGRVNALVRVEWQRVVSDPRRVVGACPSLFRGTDVHLSREVFERRWCHRGVLCTVAGAASEPPVLRCRLSVSSPVPCPPPPPPRQEAASQQASQAEAATQSWDQQLLLDLDELL